MTLIDIDPVARGALLVERVRGGRPLARRVEQVPAPAAWVPFDLAEAMAEGVDLRGGDLRRACLSRAKLRGTVLRGVDLRMAVLRGADLREACLVGADLRGADLGDALLQGAELEGAVVDMLTFTRSGWSPEPAWAWEALGLVVDRPVRAELGPVPRGRGGDALDAMREPLVEALVAYVELGRHLDAAERWWHRLRLAERPTRKGVERLLMLLGRAQACVGEVSERVELTREGVVRRERQPG